MTHLYAKGNQDKIQQIYYNRRHKSIFTANIKHIKIRISNKYKYQWETVLQGTSQLPLPSEKCLVIMLILTQF